MRMSRATLAFLAVVCTTCATGSIELSQLQEQGGVFYLSSPGEPYTGEAVSYHGDGTLKMKRILVNGRVEGLWTEWHPNGQKSYEGTWKDGKADGKSFRWYENGQMKSKEEFKMDEPAGVHDSWYENGQIKSKRPYIDDKPYGVWQFWEEDGRKDKHEVYEEGVLVKTIEAE